MADYATQLANEHFDAVEREGLQLHDGAVWDAEDRLFEIGFPESAHTLRMMIYAFRQGRTLGRKEGEIAFKVKAANLFGFDLAKGVAE
jgi:hypothetical protein